MSGLDEIRRRLDGYRLQLEQIDDRMAAMEAERRMIEARSGELSDVLSLLDPDFAEVSESRHEYEIPPVEAPLGGVAGSQAPVAAEPQRGRRSIREEVLDFLRDGAAEGYRADWVAEHLPNGAVRQQQVEAALEYWGKKGVVWLDGPSRCWCLKSREIAEPETTEIAEEYPVDESEASVPAVEPEPESLEFYPPMRLTEALRYMLEGYGLTGATWAQLELRGVPLDAIEGAVSAGEVITGDWRGLKTYRLAPEDDEEERSAAE